MKYTIDGEEVDRETFYKRLDLAAMYEVHEGWEQEGFSNSGKITFRCKTCGRISQTPDKRCMVGWRGGKFKMNS